MRDFEVVSTYKNQNIKIPKRASNGSAGYDLAIVGDYTIEPGKVKLVNTGLRVFMQENEVMLVFPRSSLGLKKGLMMSNGVGVIDSDYYHSENEGHIMIPLYNFSSKTIHLKSGERVAQGMFINYKKINSDETKESIRVGGFGSTGF